MSPLGCSLASHCFYSFCFLLFFWWWGNLLYLEAATWTWLRQSSFCLHPKLRSQGPVEWTPSFHQTRSPCCPWLHQGHRTPSLLLWSWGRWRRTLRPRGPWQRQSGQACSHWGSSSRLSRELGLIGEEGDIQIFLCLLTQPSWPFKYFVLIWVWWGAGALLCLRCNLYKNPICTFHSHLLVCQWEVWALLQPASDVQLLETARSSLRLSQRERFYKWFPDWYD